MASRSLNLTTTAARASRNLCRSSQCRPAIKAAAYSFPCTVERSSPRGGNTIARRWHSTGSTQGIGSVSNDEMKHFTSLASSWWDPQGPSRILHLMNPLRHEWIAQCLAEGKPKGQEPGDGLHYLDVGCGGGIFAESLARTIPQEATMPRSSVTLASSMTAIDPTPTMIKIAANHARKDPAVFNHLQTGTFKYINASVEDLVASGLPEQPKPKFDVITLFEVLEHVSPHTSSPQEFLKHILSLLRPGGWLIGSTIARALPAYVLHDLIAEAPWPLGVVPRGTHDWHKFVNPDEVKTWAARSLKELAREEAEASEKEVADPTAPEAPVKEHLHDPSLFMKFRSTGAVYIPGCGWKLVPALSDYGNYFFAVQKN